MDLDVTLTADREEKAVPSFVAVRSEGDVQVHGTMKQLRRYGSDKGMQTIEGILEMDPQASIRPVRANSRNVTPLHRRCLVPNE